VDRCLSRRAAELEAVRPLREAESRGSSPYGVNAATWVAMRGILTDHASRYPHWAVEDLYKLIHQAAMGSEHALTDEARMRDWLLRELAGMGPGPKEPLLDAISPDGAVVRVHLRPFVRMRFDSELLLNAFLRTAREFRRSAERLEEYAETAARLARDGVVSFAEGDVMAFVAQSRATGFPAVHHSAAFEAEYRPAYRVVARETLLSELIAVA